MIPHKPERRRPIAVFLVEDSQPFRAALRMVLEPFADQAIIIAEAANAAEAVVSLGQHRPDLMLLDLRLPSDADNHERDREHGLLVLAQARHLAPKMRVLVLTNLDRRPLTILEAKRLGARGIIAKDDVLDGYDLLTAIKQVMRGSHYSSPSIRQLLRGVSPLSPREREVCALAAAGDTNELISSKLGIARRTVNAHISNSLAKLGIASRTEIRHLM